MFSYASEKTNNLPQTKLFRHVNKALSRCRFIRLFQVEIQIPGNDNFLFPISHYCSHVSQALNVSCFVIHIRWAIAGTENKTKGIEDPVDRFQTLE